MIYRKLLFVALLVLPIFAQAAKSLSEHDVQGLLNKADMAVSEKDINLMAETASEHAVYVYHVSLDGESRSSRSSRDEYLNNLRRGWSEYENYEYVRTDTKITLESDSKATVNMVVTEYITIDGQNVQAVTNETITVEVVRGKALITKVVGYVKLEIMTMT